MEEPSVLFAEQPVEDRDTLRSVPNRRGRRRPNMEQIIYSQWIGENGSGGRRGGLGMGRRGMQESSSSRHFASSNSSQYRNSQRLSKKSKNSRNSKRSSSRRDSALNRN